MKKVSKIGALNTFLQELDKLGPAEKKMRFFRGHSKKSYGLEPSIFRNPGWIKNEEIMLKELVLRCPDDFAGGLTTFESLVKMQHYGLPTRLLDVSSNPLAALYFACESHEKDDDDGEVIVFGFDVGTVKYFDSDTVSVISNLSRRPADFEVPESANIELNNPEEVIEKFNSHEPIRLLLHDVGNDKPHFLPKIKREDLERVVCVKPLLDNPRIIRQEGAFLLFGCQKSKVRPARLQDSTIVDRLTINRDEKRNLRDKLRTLGISEATLFPEIDRVATHIKNAYSVPSIDLSKLSATQAKVFGALDDGNDHAVKNLSVALGIDKSTANRAVAELQHKGAAVLVGSGRERRWRKAKNLYVFGEMTAEPGEVRPGKIDA